MKERHSRTERHGSCSKKKSAPALNTCGKMRREDSKPAKTLLLQTLLDIHRSEPMRKNMKKPVVIEPLKKIDGIRKFSNKELRLTKEWIGHC